MQKPWPVGLIVSLGAVALATGCGGPSYDGPVSVPTVVEAAPVGFFVALDPMVPARGAPVAPMGARVVAAQCEDPSICEAIADGDEKMHAYRVFIGGTRAGKTTVRLTVEHPTLHTTSEHRVEVAFQEAALTPMKVGNDASQIDGKLQVLTDVKGEAKPLFCESSGGGAGTSAPRDGLGAKLDMGDVVRGPGVLYACSAPVTLEHGSYYARSGEAHGWAGPFRKLDHKTLYVCVHERTRERTVLSMSIYDMPQSHPVLIEHRGDDDPVCSIKK